jgi:acyl-CoA reductase-like NAD-dependent aldehyde dehydrogenase
MESFDPGTARAFVEFARGDDSDVEAAVESARKALNGVWRRMTPAERGRILTRTAQLIRAHAERYAVVECLDSGKPIGEARVDVASAARSFEYYAGACDKMHGLSIPLGPDYVAYSVNEPVGVTAHVIPWNFPISTTARGVAPALAAGCTVVAKPAEQTPLTALLLAETLKEAGLPDGVYNVVTGTGAEVGGPLVSHPDVAHVTFTGSVATGCSVMQAAARNVTSVTLELGGKSPAVVMADCDLAMAVDDILGAIYENAGQVCSAAARLVIERPVQAEFLDRFAARVGALSMGHGLRNPRIGPVSSPGQLGRVIDFVNDARANGTEIVVGGSPTVDPETGHGWFFEPTVLNDVRVTDRVAQNEIFGPVLCVQPFDDVDEAVAIANSTNFALVAGVYTSNFGVAHRLARDIDAGQVFINEYFAGGIEVPFGGNRHSGIGREKGLDAMRNYFKVKSVAARIRHPANR